VRPLRIKGLAPLITIGFIVAVAYHFIALAAVDAPHNESNKIDCGSCHGKGILESIFWGGSGTYDSVCLWKCHTEPFCPYTDLSAPKMETHKDSDGNALAECRTCHDPHYQKQKNYKNTDWNNLYLAYGTITSYEYYDPDDYGGAYFDPDLRDTSALAYSSIIYKTKTSWDAARLIGKTEDCRHTILFPNVKKLGYSYPIIAIAEDTPTTGTITVKGDVTPVYQYISTSDFAVMYGQYIRDNINGKAVKYFDPEGENSFADGDEVYNGVCEVCHTKTKYYRNDGSGAEHYTGNTCRDCHNHLDEFAHGGDDCIKCHGHDAGYEYSSGQFSQGKGTYISHSTHTENDTDDVKGPFIVCAVCHDTNNYPYFKSGADSDGDGKYGLTETDVCDPCHSLDGPFDGIDDAVIGAKSNWDTGVYEGYVLKAGKEHWCVGCHDSGTSVCKGVSAPDVSGDNSTYGYYVNGHKSKLCTDCHDMTQPHIDGEARTYAFDSEYYGPIQSGVAYASGYRLQYINGEVPLMIPANYNITFSYDAQNIIDNAFRLCFDCHQSSEILDNTPGDGLDSYFKASLPNPPRNYSYAWGSGADSPEHVAHLLNYIGPFWDSDWDDVTVGPGGSNGCDSLTSCSSCHNVHGASVSYTSTNEPMIRDGSLVGRTGYGFSYVIEDVSVGGYPKVTSTGATRSTSVGAIFRNNTANMCAGSMCHGTPSPPAASSYDASGSSWGTYLEYYRPVPNN
jgi:hypothetical protein